MCTTIDFPEHFQANPARGVLTGERLAHWNTLLEEWCKIHERYCRMVERDAIFWYTERSNIGALAGAAWLSGWAAMEEFTHDRRVKHSNARGRADLFMKSPVSEYFVESKLVWCREGSNPRTARARKGMRAACKDARTLHQEEDTGIKRVGVVFAIPSLPVGDCRTLPSVLSEFVTIMHSDGLDAVAWCFPPGAELRVSGRREYPGVFLLAKLAS